MLRARPREPTCLVYISGVAGGFEGWDGSTPEPPESWDRYVTGSCVMD